METEFVDVRERWGGAFADSDCSCSHSHSQLCSLSMAELPSELFQMRKAKKLWLDDNKLRSLPNAIGQLSQLEILSVCLGFASAHIVRDRTVDQHAGFRSTATKSLSFLPRSAS